jgi:hypothetical protein
MARFRRGSAIRKVRNEYPPFGRQCIAQWRRTRLETDSDGSILRGRARPLGSDGDNRRQAVHQFVGARGIAQVPSQSLGRR